MTKAELKKVISQSADEILAEYSQQAIMEKLEEYADESGELTKEGFAMFSFFESQKYAEQLLASVLGKVMPLDD